MSIVGGIRLCGVVQRVGVEIAGSRVAAGGYGHIGVVCISEGGVMNPAWNDIGTTTQSHCSVLLAHGRQKPELCVKLGRYERLGRRV